MEIEATGTAPSKAYEHSEQKHPASNHASDASEAGAPDEVAASTNHLHGIRLAIAVTGVLLSVFLTGLDQTVVANALPIIASVFNELANLTWVPTAFLITQVACLPLFGQLPVLFPISWVFLFTIVIFGIGSLLSAVSPNFGFLIFARAFQGVGAGGIFVCSLVVIAEIVPLKDRSKYLGALGGVFALGTVIGPLIGGGLADRVSWRWCFYINLPISAPTLLASIMFIRTHKIAKTVNTESTAVKPMSFISKLYKLDILGFILMLGFTICLVLGLQWGGNIKPWRSAAVIVPLVLAGLLVIVFYAWQRYKKSAAIVPLILLQSRTMIGACLVGLFSRMGFFTATYFLPLYLQAVHNHSAVQSGVDLLPLSIAVMLSAGVFGGIISRVGRYWHVMFFGPWVAIIAFGLFFTLDEHSSAGKYVGYQILAGIGIGSTTQVVVLAAQADVSQEYVSQASALVTFIQWLGGIIGLTVAGAVFQNKLASGLREFAPSAPFDELRQTVSALSTLSGSEHDGAVHAYVKALQFVFVCVAVPASALSSFATLLVKNRRLKPKTDEVRMEATEVKTREKIQDTSGTAEKSKSLEGPQDQV